MLPDAALPSLHLTYRPDLHILTGRWLADVPLAEFQREYAAIIAAAQTHDAWRWLLDVRRRPVPPAGAAEWLATQALPQAAALAPGRLRIAYLVSPQRQHLITADPTLRHTVTDMLARSPYDMTLLGDEGQAMRWLLA